MTAPDIRAAETASRQYGLITWAQALACGLTSARILNRLATGRWVRVFDGVFRIAGAESSWRSAVLAACLSGGVDAYASHSTAGTLLEIRTPPRSRIEITLPYACCPKAFGFTVHRSRIPDRSGFSGAIPVSSPARTLLDLAGTFPMGRVEEALDVVLRRRLVTVEEMDEYLTSLGRVPRKGIGGLRRLVDERAGRKRHPDGTFTTRVMRILRRARVKLPELEYEVRRDGHLLGRVDLCYPGERVFIELDGWEWHSSRQAFDRDHIRRNLIVEAGYLPLGFTWSDLDRPRYVADLVRSMLRQRADHAS